MRSEFISFQKGKSVLGRIAQCKPGSGTSSSAGRGVVLESVGGDFAEWHPVLQCPPVKGDDACGSYSGLSGPLCGGDSGDCGDGGKQGKIYGTLGEGEVVGLHAGGGVSRVTRTSRGGFTGAVGVVSRRAVVRGGLPTDGDCNGYESIAYVGRVPIRVRGAVRCVVTLWPS